MTARAHGDPDAPLPQSPYVWESPDYQGNRIRITVTFDNATRALTGGSVFRDAACVYRKIYIGVGVDGSPDSTTHKFTVPAGTTAVSAAQMAAVGFTTIEQFLALQITAGP
jgi:hypothetical protein